MPRLWIDTNVALSTLDLRDLARRAQKKHVDIVFHPQVYLEGRRQERARRGDKFSETRFNGLLVQLGIAVVVVTLDQETSSAWADELFRRYPTTTAWENAKKRTLGGELKAGFSALPGQMPMTTDWLIALTVWNDPDARVITHDAGEEWSLLRESDPSRVFSWDEAIEWLDSLPLDQFS